jgi:hypothetical protein
MASAFHYRYEHKVPLPHICCLIVGAGTVILLITSSCG